MKLILDVGNTLTKEYLLKNDLLVKETSFDDNYLKNTLDFIAENEIEYVFISASGKIDDALISFLKNNYQTIEFTDATLLPIHNYYQTSKTLGKDRLAAVVGANELYPGEASLVIDAGTCITYDAIDANGNYYGGSISPGLKMRGRAMHEFTAKLPLVELAEIPYDIGFDTTSSMLTGVILGACYEIEGFINQYLIKYKTLNVILTGGNAALIASYIHHPVKIDKKISLWGLNKILNYNVDKQNL